MLLSSRFTPRPPFSCHHAMSNPAALLFVTLFLVPDMGCPAIALLVTSCPVILMLVTRFPDCVTPCPVILRHPSPYCTNACHSSGSPSHLMTCHSEVCQPIACPHQLVTLYPNHLYECLVTLMFLYPVPCPWFTCWPVTLMLSTLQLVPRTCHSIPCPYSSCCPVILLLTTRFPVSFPLVALSFWCSLPHSLSTQSIALSL